MSGPLSVPDGPLLEEPPSAQEIAKAKENWLRMPSVEKAKIRQADAEAEKLVAEVLASSVQEAFHPDQLRGPDGKWVKTAEGKGTVQDALDRISALGLKVHPPGPESTLTPEQAGQIAGVLETAMKRYPILHDPKSPRPLKHVVFTSGENETSRIERDETPPGSAAAVTSTNRKPFQWMGFNDTLDAFDNEGLPPNYATPATLSGPEGVAWHELGHAVANAANVSGPGIPGFDTHSQRLRSLLTGMGVEPSDIYPLSMYGASDPDEAVGELFAMWNVPGFRDKLPPKLREATAKMVKEFETVHPYEGDEESELAQLQQPGDDPYDGYTPGPRFW